MPEGIELSIGGKGKLRSGENSLCIAEGKEFPLFDKKCGCSFKLDVRYNSIKVTIEVFPLKSQRRIA